MRESLLIGMGGMLAVGVGLFGLWISATSSIRANYRHGVVALAQAAAVQIDPTLHAQLHDPADRNSVPYNRAIAPLIRMRDASADIQDIYTMVLDRDAIRFVLDTGPPRNYVGKDNQAGVWELYTKTDPFLFAVLRGEIVGDDASAREPFTDASGTFMSGWAPIVDAEHHRIGVTGVAVNAEVYIARLAEARRWALLGILPSAILLFVLAIVYYRQRLRGLRSAANLVIQQDRLRASESSFRSLFELSPVGFALSDLRSGRFLRVNDSFSQSCGYGREELLERRYWDMVPGHRSIEGRALMGTIAPKTHYGPSEREYMRKDGRCYPVLISEICLTDAYGQDVVWSIVQDISERKAFEEQQIDAARRDKLTGLANRLRFMERLQQEIAWCKAEEHRHFAVLFLDFDRFKMINDTLGHEAGDELLRQIAQRLRMALRDGETVESETCGNIVARFGGDEFLILISNLAAIHDATRVADRLLEALAPAYTLLGRTVHSTASIGIVTSDQCQEDADAIIRCADAAMYEAKRAGAARSVVFTTSMQTQLMRRVRIESDLRGAIGTSQLFLVYQPIVDLQTGGTESIEALLRWNHPELGGIPPSEFVPVAEQSGLIFELAEWVLPEACRMLAAWRSRDRSSAPRSVSVNVSRAELRLGQRLLDRVRETLASTGLPAQCLQLEITEHQVMQDPAYMQSVLLELRGMGVRLAMDDFGTGASSLGCLRHFPFDAIKVDRSFLQGLSGNSEGLAVIHATFMLINNLGKSSVAEGIEDASQVAILQSVGCSYGQGYLFGRPVRAEELGSCAGGATMNAAITPNTPIETPPATGRDRDVDIHDEMDEAPRRLGDVRHQQGRLR
jgi:diguanylate cyclase (GGDEF)-like protein/PAS domain S-box-containing protein